MESLPGVAGAGQSNLSTGVAALIQDQMVSSPISPVVRSFSPDQDFIEMDFDPGFESDEPGSDDSGQGGERERGEVEELQVEEEEDLAGLLEEEERDSSVSPGPALVLEAVCLPLPANNNNNNSVLEKESSPTVTANLPDCEGEATLMSPTHPSSAPVLSPSEEVRLVMPRSRSLNSSLGECLLHPGGQARTNNLSLCGSRLMQREALMFGGDSSHSRHSCQQQGQSGQPEQPELDDLMSALYRLTLPETPLPLRVPAATNRVMIWTEKEAVRKQVSHSDRLSDHNIFMIFMVQVIGVTSRHRTNQF